MAKTTKSIEEAQKIFNKARETEEALKKEPVDNFLEEAPRARRERPKDLETVTSGATYWKFDEEPVFEGHFVSKFLAPKDIPQAGGKVTKAGDVIGYNFVDSNTGEFVIISNSHAIDKALEGDGFNKETIWWIEFIAKEVVKGKPFNRFYIAKRAK